MRYFAQFDVASGPFKDCSKLAVFHQPQRRKNEKASYLEITKFSTFGLYLKIDQDEISDRLVYMHGFGLKNFSVLARGAYVQKIRHYGYLKGENLVGENVLSVKTSSLGQKFRHFSLTKILPVLFTERRKIKS